MDKYLEKGKFVILLVSNKYRAMALKNTYNNNDVIFDANLQGISSGVDYSGDIKGACMHIGTFMRKNFEYYYTIKNGTTRPIKIIVDDYNKLMRTAKIKGQNYIALFDKWAEKHPNIEVVRRGYNQLVDKIPANINSFEVYKDCKGLMLSRMLNDISYNIRLNADDCKGYYLFTNSKTDIIGLARFFSLKNIKYKLVVGGDMAGYLFDKVYKTNCGEGQEQVTILTSSSFDGLDISNKLDKSKVYFIANFHYKSQAFHPEDVYNCLARFKDTQNIDLQLSISNKDKGKISNYEMVGRYNCENLVKNVRDDVNASFSDYVYTFSRNITFRVFNNIAYDLDRLVIKMDTTAYVNRIEGLIGKDHKQAKYRDDELKKTKTSVTALYRRLSKNKYNKEDIINANIGYFEADYGVDFYHRYLRQKKFSSAYLSSENVKKKVLSKTIAKDLQEFRDIYRIVRYGEKVRDIDYFMENYHREPSNFYSLVDKVKGDKFEKLGDGCLAGSVLGHMLNIMHIGGAGAKNKEVANRIYNSTCQLSDDSIKMINGEFGYHTIFLDLSGVLLYTAFDKMGYKERFRSDIYDIGAKNLGLTREQVKKKTNILLNIDCLPMSDGLFALKYAGKYKEYRRDVLLKELKKIAMWFSKAYNMIGYRQWECFILARIDAYSDPLYYASNYKEKCAVDMLKDIVGDLFDVNDMGFIRKHDCLIVYSKDERLITDLSYHLDCLYDNLEGSEYIQMIDVNKFKLKNETEYKQKNEPQRVEAV